jgi:hypothetical protein
VEKKFYLQIVSFEIEGRSKVLGWFNFRSLKRNGMQIHEGNIKNLFMNVLLKIIKIKFK